MDLGLLEYQPEDLIVFPQGLPSFESLHEYLLVQQAEFAPFLFLFSADRPAVRFVCLPAYVLDPGYRFEVLPDEDLPATLAPGVYRARSERPMILAIVTLPQDGVPTANLMAPLVIDAERRIGMQLILAGSAYSHITPIGECQPEPAPC